MNRQQTRSSALQHESLGLRPLG